MSTAAAEQAMADYLAAGVDADIEQLCEFYAADFVNVRIGGDGAVRLIDRAAMVASLRALIATGGRLGTTEDVRMLATTTYGPHTSIVLSRTKRGVEFVYNFVWDGGGERPVLVREFTTAVRHS